MEFHPQLPSASLIVSRCFRHVFLINFSSRVCPAKSIDKFIRLYDFIGIAGALPEKEGQNGNHISTTFAASQVL